MDRRSFIMAGASTLLLPACAAGPRTGLPATLAWQKLPTVAYRGKQDDIAFGSPSHGWYGNGEGRLYRTEDGGDSWEQVWHQPGTFVRALGFADERNGIMGNVGIGSFPGVTDTNPLYRTSDGGLSWAPVERIDGPVPQGICGIDIVRQTFIDRGARARRTIVHAAGRVGGPAHYLRSLDGGANWTSRDLSALTAAIFDVKFLDSTTGFIAGTSDRELSRASGLILRSDDGGESWREVFRTARPFETVWKLHFPTERTGYGTIQSYNPDSGVARRYVAKSGNRGRDWSELPLIEDSGWRSFGIGFADERLGWVGGASGGLETRDGGRSWAPAPIGRAVNKIRFVGGDGAARRVYAIGTEVHRLDLG